MEFTGIYAAKVFTFITTVLLFSSLPSCQELANVRRMEDLALNPRTQFTSGSEASAHGARMLNLAQQRNGQASSFRHWAPATEGNVTLESLGESLTRLEGNMASLIQSFLSLQRSVFNLEQLQELLVLLLEDILKQTGNMDRGETNGQNRPDKTGGSSEESGDSDGNVSGDTDGDVDDANGNGMQNGDQATKNGGKGGNKGNGQGTDPLLSTTEIGVSENMYRDTGMGTAGRQRQNLNSIQGDDSHISGGGSSEGGKSYSTEDNSGQWPTVTQGQNQQPRNTDVNRPTKSQWSEPITAQSTSQIHDRFNDMVRRIASRLGANTRIHSRSQRLGNMRMASGAHRTAPESTLARPPSFEPLEIVPAIDSLGAKEKSMPEMLPFHVKLRQMSQVVSHGGPLTGPEKTSTLFMENLGGVPTSENAGERPTGMINNLVQPGNGPTFKDAGVDNLTTERQIPVFDIRKRRQSGNLINGQPLVQEMISVDRLAMPRVVVSDSNTNARIKISEPNPSKEATYSLADTQLIDLSLQVSQKDIGTEKFPESILSGTSPGKRYQQTSRVKDGKKSMQKEIGTDQEYDFLIASLLKDLTTKLQKEHLENSHGYDNTSDGVINRVINELNKLIWIPSDNLINLPTSNPITDATQSLVTDLSKLTSDPQTDIVKSPPTGATSTPQSNSVDKKINQNTKTKTVNSIPVNVKPEEETLIYTLAVSVQDNVSQTGGTDEPQGNSTVTITPSPEPPSIDLKSATPTLFTTPAALHTTTSNPWTWLKEVTTNSKHATVDLEWLTEALAELSQLEHLIEDMQEFSDKGRLLVYNRQKKDENKEKGLGDRDGDNDNLSIRNGNSKDSEDEHRIEDEEASIGGLLHRKNESLQLIAPDENISGNDEIEDYNQDDSEDNIFYDSIKDDGQVNTIFSTFQESAEISNMVTKDLESDESYSNDQDDEASELNNIDSGEDNETSTMTEDDYSYDMNSYESGESNDSDKSGESKDTDDGNDFSTPKPATQTQNQASELNAVTGHTTDYSQEDLIQENEYRNNNPDDFGNNNVLTDMDDVNKVPQYNSNEQISKESQEDDQQIFFYPGSQQHLQDMQQPQLQAPPHVPSYHGSFPISQDKVRAVTGIDDSVQQMNYLNLITQGRFRKRRYVNKGKQRFMKRHARYKRQAPSYWHNIFNTDPQTLQYPSRQTYPGGQATQYARTNSVQSTRNSISNGRNTQMASVTGQKPQTSSQGSRARPVNTHQNSWYGNPHSQYQRPSSQYHSVGSQQTGRQNSLYPQNRNSHYSGHNRQFNIPIAGYPNYFSHMGLNFPNLGFSGFNPLELGELDMEEILTNLFRRYWQQVNNLFTTPGILASTTPDLDLEEIITTTTTVSTTQPKATTTSAPAVTNSTVASSVTESVSNATSPEIKNSTTVQPNRNKTLLADMSTVATEYTRDLNSPPSTTLTPP